MNRYLWSGDWNLLPRQTCDVVIIGTGLAGIYTALHLDPSLKVILINKSSIEESNSMYAQGGIAAAVAPGDSPSQHYDDSWEAGVGLCNPAALQILVTEGPENIRLLQSWGVPFDLDTSGNLVVSREAAHRRNRIVHCHGDSTGFYVTASLAQRLAAQTNCRVIEKTCLVDFLTDSTGEIAGILTLTADAPGEYRIILAKHVILASGGIGGLFPRTTNASTATGDGLAAALRCGVAVKDLEFIQFHPTALPKPDAQGRCFLISEAVRGEGGILRDKAGKAFMAAIHPLADLAPRDVVSRAIFRQMQVDGSDHVWLDITHRDRDFLMRRFPMIYETCAKIGLDMAAQWLPVAPVQHYFMGGVKTDLSGRTSCRGLWAVGESACTGIYGANRLASNSLLECLVFGRRIARAINEGDAGDGPATAETAAATVTADSGGAPRAPAFVGSAQPAPATKVLAADRIQTIRQQVRQLMERYCGILRNHDGLQMADTQLEILEREVAGITIADRLTLETCQMIPAARSIVQAALRRKHSVGAHFRTDDPSGAQNRAQAENRSGIQPESAGAGVVAR
jgi:L-aspartate oxidase